MNKVDFFIPVSFNGKFPTLKNKLLEACDRYLALSHRIAIVRSEEKKDRVYGAINSFDPPSSLVLTALKVISYFTVILPLLALVAKFILRTMTTVNYSTSEFARGVAVMYAALGGHAACITALLANGAVISEASRGEAVMAAARGGHLACIDVLLANGAVISEASRGEAVMDATQGGHLACIQALLANGAISERARGRAVKAAACYGHLDCITALLANGAISEAYRGIAVSISAGGGHLEIIQALLANGAISEADRGRAVMDATQGGHLACAQALLPPGTNLEAYLVAGGAGRMSVSRVDLMADPRQFLTRFTTSGIPSSIEFSGEPALDAGGVTKECLSLLCSSLVEKNVLKLSNALPCVAEGSSTESADLEAYKLFGQFLVKLEEKNIGRLDPIFTGRLLDDAVFQMLKIQMGESAEAEKQLALATCVCEKVPLMAPLGAFLKGGERSEAPAKELLESLGEEVETLDAAGLRGLCSAQFERYRKPIVALAEGVSTGPALRAYILAADPAVVSASIQGSPLDRERLAKAMYLQEKPLALSPADYAVMQQKFDWILEKIRDKSTPIEWLKEFLQAVTGQSVMGAGLRIKVDQGSSPVPTASTCFNALRIDTTVLTKAEFLENLELLVQTKGFGNT